jgi:hypothetical protein
VHVVVDVAVFVLVDVAVVVHGFYQPLCRHRPTSAAIRPSADFTGLKLLYR